MCATGDHLGNGKDSLKNFCDSVSNSNTVARSCLVVSGASQAVISIHIQFLATFTDVVFNVIEDFKTEFSLEANVEGVFLHPVGIF